MFFTNPDLQCHLYLSLVSNSLKSSEYIASLNIEVGFNLIFNVYHFRSSSKYASEIGFSFTLPVPSLLERVSITLIYVDILLESTANIYLYLG